jgi:general secretion pathway protein B
VPAAAVAADAPAPAPAVAPATVPTYATPPPVLRAAEPLDPLIPEPMPAAPPRASPAPSAGPVNAAGLRTAQELRAAGVALPPLLMNLHAWAATPAERYVLLNGLRLMEGEHTPDGILVEAITEEGVVLQARGQRFMLPRGS